MNKKKTFTNLFSLTSIQLLNYLLPLITMPYLVRTIGIGGYGLLSFAQATMQYFILLTDYGFNIIGTQKIALCKNDLKKRNQVFSQILVTKLFLLMIAFLILGGMMLFIPKMQENPGLYFIMFSIVLGNVLFPVWFFQGIEEMSAIGILNFLGKFIFTVGIFLLVKTPSDIYLAGFLNGLGYLIVGLLGLGIAVKRYQVHFEKVTFLKIKQALKEAWHLFVANISTSFYTTTNIFVLGLVAGDQATGYFNLANTLVRACASSAVPITQTFFPKIAVKVKESPQEAKSWIQKLFYLYTGVFTAGCLILLFASKPLLAFMFHDTFLHAIPFIQVMSFLPLMVAWGNIFGVLIMTLFGFQKELSRIYFLGGILSLLGMLILTFRYQALGTAWNAFLTETVITLMMIFFLVRKNFFKKELN